MKTFQVTIISIIALALSGCATGYYQRGYVGYNTGYSSPSHYQSYGRSYYSPGTSFSYGREYVQPSYGYERREHEHHHDRHNDWSPAPRLNHQGSWNGWQNRGMGRESVPSRQHVEQSPRWGGGHAETQRRMPEHGQDGGHDGGRWHHGRHGE